MKLIWLSSLWFCAALPAHAQIETIAMGFALRDSVLVYADSSREARVLAQLEFADYVTVLGIVERVSTLQSSNGWSRIEFENERRGWARFEDFVVGDHVCIVVSAGDSIYQRPESNTAFRAATSREFWRITQRVRVAETNWFAGRDGWLRTRKFEPLMGDAYYKLLRAYEGSSHEMKNLQRKRRDHAAALRVLAKLEQQCAVSDTLYLDPYLEEMDERNSEVGAGAFLAYQRRLCYFSLNQIEQMLAEGEKMERLYGEQQIFNGRAGPYAGLQLANDYLHHAHDTTRALEKYHEVIRKYPNETIFGFEWNDWVDDAAARAIVALSGNDPERLLRESQRILAESQVPQIQLIGYSGLVKGMGLRGEMAAMRDTTFAVITRFLETSRTFYHSELSYANKVAMAALAACEERGDSESFDDLCDSLSHHFREDRIGAAAVLRKAMRADRSNANIAALKQQYLRVVNDFAQFNFYEPGVGELGTHVARMRLQELEEAGYKRAEVIGANVPLHRDLDRKQEPLQHLPRGLQVRVLYNDAAFSHSPYVSHHTKIMLTDSVIGWVENDKIRVSHPALLPLRRANPKTWDMAWANAQNNPVFPDPSIKQPRVRAVLDSQRLYDLRVYDVNNDDRLDFIVRNRNGGFTALDGNNARSSLWNVVSNNLDPALGSGNMFHLMTGYKPSKPYECELLATRLANGTNAWRRSFGPMTAADLLYFDQRVYVLARDNFLFCIRASDGEYLWKISAGPNGGAPVKIGINANALIAITSQSARAFDPMSGNALWESSIDLGYATVPVLEGESFYLAARAQVQARTLKSGRTVWQQAAQPNFSGGPSCVMNEKIFFAEAASVTALRQADGAILWRNETIQESSSLIAVEGVLYLQGLLNGQRHLLALQQSNGQIIWAMPLEGHIARMIYQDRFLFMEGRTGIVVVGDSAWEK